MTTAAQEVENQDHNLSNLKKKIIFIYLFHNIYYFFILLIPKILV